MFVDLHLHLLPGVDDGARDLDESIAMARTLCASGYGRAVLTPHIRPDRFDNDAEALRERLREVRRALGEAEVALELHEGAEHYLCPEVIARLLAGEALPLAGGRYALIEAPLTGPQPALAEIVFRLALGGVHVVFAHPERCECMQEVAVVRALAEKGAHFQLDLGSLAGAYGGSARRVARKLLAADLYAVAGTDLHRPEQAKKVLPRWLEALQARATPELAARLLTENPTRVLENAPLVTGDTSVTR